MTRDNAIFLWNALCSTVLGVDADNQEVSQPTPFGVVALSHDLTTFLYPEERHAAHRRAVAAFLRRFADAIDGVKAQSPVSPPPLPPIDASTLEWKKKSDGPESQATVGDFRLSVLGDRTPWTCRISLDNLLVAVLACPRDCISIESAQEYCVGILNSIAAAIDDARSPAPCPQ